LRKEGGCAQLEMTRERRSKKGKRKEKKGGHPDRERRRARST
jgi:hypothetical protein